MVVISRVLCSRIKSLELAIYHFLGRSTCPLPKSRFVSRLPAKESSSTSYLKFLVCPPISPPFSISLHISILCFWRSRLSSSSSVTCLIVFCLLYSHSSSCFLCLSLDFRYSHYPMPFRTWGREHYWDHELTL